MGKSSPRKYPSPFLKNKDRGDFTPPNLQWSKEDLVREVMSQEAYEESTAPRPPKSERREASLRMSPPRMAKSLPRMKFGPFHVEPTPPSTVM